MPLTPGTRLGSYEVVALLGVGGMGEVYRARDTKLDRDVAIKVLPDAFVADPDRVARFQREAKTLASLNHANIGGIHGLEEADGVKALVLELIDGPTLADRIAQGPLPIDEALPIAKQIAEALEAAHEQGVIHRDLKPANIKLRPDGAVKVLDFGLAKAIDSGPGAASSVSMSPTITTPAMTLAGVILGTAAYMSPEQAKGRVADKRSDVWAFGCVLYEMLTGKRAFDGEDVSDTLAVVLRGSPDWEALPAATPPSIVKLVKNCLQRDRKERVPDIAVARLEIRDALAAPPSVLAQAPARQLAQAPKPLSRRAAPLAVTAMLAAAATGGAVWLLKPVPPTARPVTRFTVNLPDGQNFTNNNSQSLSLSPDGSRLVYVANQQLFARSMTDLQPRPIPGTSETPSPIAPVFSPDGEWIAYFSQQTRQIKRIAWSGGAAVPICAAVAPLGMRWDGEEILFGQPKGIMRVSANGGEPEAVVSAKEGETLHGAQRLPGQEWILMTVAPGTNPSVDVWDKAVVVAHSLKSSERRTLVSGGSDGRYLATGHIVYAVGGVLFAVRFDPGSITVAGGPVPVVEGVKRSLTGSTGAAHVSASDTGSLAFIPGRIASGGDSDLGIVDRSGTIEPLKLPPGPYEFPRRSPDGNWVAFGSDDGRDAAIMVYNLSSKSSPRPLTVGGRNRIPIWSQDSTYVFFQSDREGDLAIFRQRADGTAPAERVTKPDKDTEHLPESISPDGKTLLVSVKKGGVYLLGAWSMIEKVLTVPFAGIQSVFPVSSTFHPDGKWFAYTSSSPGTSAPPLFVQPFPPTGSIYPITKTGAIHPTWSPTGKELSFGSGPGLYSVVSVSTTPSFTFGNPVPVPKILLERGPTAERSHDVMPDGQRFLGVIQAVSPAGMVTAPQIQVVLNWFEDLKARVPAGREK